ncbi:putative polynucleotide adenylyltransferase [Senna tora]|uniref:Putative polynucleotide adenylyltransferase n=1 Tax=Senna tora TaxID=362788 RepID=A0A834T6U6_9FABA|nr:putative polynucleotide adenylyltransferase [Senna tora]
MADLQVSSPRANGAVIVEDRLCSSPPSSPLPPSNADPSAVGVEAWSRAEKTTHDILCRIQPTLGANQRRKEVVDYVQKLIKYGVGCEVFPYGSVPLKTYLPDGDIDLTALSCQNIEDALVSDVHAVLKGEEINEAAEYEVKDVRFIDAEVKLVKCIVQNIVVDISFNQLGGLCTLCFLEKVDRLVGKDHLFKRSIILIKAWCYYESRILGAHHGLISTYALEALVLYIFHQFHLSLDGPLAVLYRFLDYFSKFDWDNYCVSLKGPVSKSSLPDIVAEVPENGRNTLLTEEFIRSCVESFSVPSRGFEQNLRAFPQKHLNIIDPLKENNNLGRSVNRGNFYRIRSAFKYGARKLGWILMLPEDKIADELNKFFANTLDRHGSTHWDELQSPSLGYSARGFDFSSFSDTRLCSEDMSVLNLSEGFNKDVMLGSQRKSEIRDERERYLAKDAYSRTVPLYDSTGDKNAVSGYSPGDDIKNVATSEVLGLTSNGSSYCSNVRTQFSNSLSGKHLTNSNPGWLRENGKVEKRISCTESVVNSVVDDEKEKHNMVSNSPCSSTDDKNMASYGSAVLNNSVDNFNNCSSPQGDRFILSASAGSEAAKVLLDLTGDYESNIRNLQYGQICYGYAVSPLVVPSPPISPKLQNRNPWETVRQCLQINHNIHPQTNSNGVVVGQQLYVVNHHTLPIAPFGPEEKKKPRGTGAYFPNMASRPYRDRPAPGRGRGQVPGTHGQLQRHTRKYGLAPAPQEVNMPVDGSFELALEGYPVIGGVKSRLSENYFSHPSTWGSQHANGLPHPSEKHESDTVSPQLRGPPRPEVSSHPESGISNSRSSVPSMDVVAEESSNSISEVDRRRIEVQAYHLKNEDDFPPLSH